MRGDLPHLDEIVFPAYAGVSPRSGAALSRSGRVPRLCGGEPVIVGLPARGRECSPPMRG